MPRIYYQLNNMKKYQEYGSANPVEDSESKLDIDRFDVGSVGRPDIEITCCDYAKKIGWFSMALFFTGVYLYYVIKLFGI